MTDHDMNFRVVQPGRNFKSLHRYFDRAREQQRRLLTTCAAYIEEWNGKEWVRV